MTQMYVKEYKHICVVSNILQLKPYVCIQKLPICSPTHLWQDKQDLLKQFVNCKENLEQVETTLRVTCEQQGEVAHTKELLTIKEMKDRGFSAIL